MTDYCEQLSWRIAEETGDLVASRETNHRLATKEELLEFVEPHGQTSFDIDDQFGDYRSPQGEALAAGLAGRTIRFRDQGLSFNFTRVGLAAYMKHELNLDGREVHIKPELHRHEKASFKLMASDNGVQYFLECGDRQLLGLLSLCDWEFTDLQPGDSR